MNGSGMGAAWRLAAAGPPLLQLLELQQWDWMDCSGMGAAWRLAAAGTPLLQLMDWRLAAAGQPLLQLLLFIQPAKPLEGWVSSSFWG